MAINFQQTDTVADSGFNVGCSGVSAGNITQSREMLEGATAGTTQFLPDPGNVTNVACVAFQSDTGVALPTTWDAGDYVVPINVTATRGATWVATYICERTSGGVYNTVASLTGQSTSVGSLGVKTHTVNRATNYSASANSTLYIVLVFDGPAHGGSNFGITPDQVITTPLVDSSATTGTGAQTLPSLSQAGSGGQTFTGSGAQSLPAPVQAGGGTHTENATATGAQSLPAMVQAGAGDLALAATGTQSLPAATQSGTGAETFTGAGAQALPAATQAGSGQEQFTATGAQVLPAATQSGTGLTQPAGSGAQALPSLVQAGAGTHGDGTTGGGAQNLPAAGQAAAGVEQFAGTADSLLPGLRQSGAAAILLSGSAALSLPALMQSGAQASGFVAGNASIFGNQSRTALYGGEARAAEYGGQARGTSFGGQI